MTAPNTTSPGADLAEAFEVVVEKKVRQPEGLLSRVVTGRKLSPPRILLYGVPGIGKALADGEPVLTPNGWKAIETLRVGDSVCTPSGRHAKVVGVYPQGSKPCAVVRTTAGAEVVASLDHLWETTDARGRTAIRTTQQISDSLSYCGKRNHYIQPTKQQTFGAASDLPLDPYLLGAWLGDGSKNAAIITNPDHEVLEAVIEGAAAAGQQAYLRDNGPGKCSSICVVSRRGSGGAGRSEVIDALRSLGLWGKGSHERFIPTAYQLASADDRMRLLSGLLDTDGTVTAQGSVQYDTTSKGLAEGVAFLARSLGAVVRIKSKVGRYRNHAGEQVECRRSYRLGISLPQGLNPFTVERKRERVVCPQERYLRHYIDSVEPVGVRSATCIKIDDPDELFITRGFAATHNTTFGAHAPEPIFVSTEDGMGTLEAPRFPRCSSWEQVIQAIGALYQEQHDYRTLVLDSLDELEPLLFAYTARKHGKEDIEAFGYGKGFSTYAPIEMRVLIEGLEALRSERGMAVIMIAHSEVVRFDAPDTEPYDTYAPRLHKHLRPIVEDWADTILFANYEVQTRKTGEERFGKQRTRGIGDGTRVMHTEQRPAWTAKNRWNLPPTMPFAWAEFQAALNESINGNQTQNQNQES